MEENPIVKTEPDEEIKLVRQEPEENPDVKHDPDSVKLKSDVDKPEVIPDVKHDLDSVKLKSDVNKPEEIPDVKQDLDPVKLKSGIDSREIHLENNSDEYHCSGCAVMYSPKIQGLVQQLKDYLEKEKANE